jgi:hypothetical protein
LSRRSPRCAPSTPPINHPPRRPQKHARAALVAEAAYALWLFVVQREACGLRDSRTVMREYEVPAEVRDRMGTFP